MAPPRNAPARRLPWYQILWEHNVVSILLSICILVWLLYPTEADPNSYVSLESQYPINCDSDESVKSLAIVGAGSAGASAAYYLNKFRNSCTRLNITVFERSSYVGGRSTTVNVYDDPTEPVELGASIFVEVNRNLVSAAREFGLTTQGSQTRDLPATLGVYDGAFWHFRSSKSSWWTTAKLLWKYGMAPIRTQNLMKKTTGKFFNMYKRPYFPFRDLSQTAYDLGLTEATAATGEEYLEKNGIQPPFTTDIIQASTRVNYAQNIDKIHGLEAMVCMATDGAMQVEGGNWQIFDGMLKASGAHVYLNTSVTSINRNPNGTYAVDALSASANHLSSYDTVIIAAPLQYADIVLEPAPLNPPPEIPYVELHVTLFTSPRALDPQAFHLGWLFDTVPTTVLTTPSDENYLPLPFFSISTLRRVRNPKTAEQEYLYKIFSPGPLESSFLDSILMPPTDPGRVTWRYDKVWNSYPYLPPRVTFEDIQLDIDGKVWYTSGMESFISTMETSSLMGMNVARLIVEGWMDEENSHDKRASTEQVPIAAEAAKEL